MSRFQELIKNKEFIQRNLEKLQQIALTLNNHIPDEIKINLEKEVSSMKCSLKRVYQMRDSLNKKENELKQMTLEKEKASRDLKEREEFLLGL